MTKPLVRQTFIQTSSRSRAWRARKTQNSKLFFLTPRRISAKICPKLENVLAISTPTLAFFSIGPVVSELGDSENFGGNAHRGFCLEMPNLPSESHQCQHLLFGFYQHRPRVRPCGAKKFAILAIFHVFWSRMPQIFTDFSVKFGIRESCRPWGEKPQNRTLSYCNTGGCPTRNKKLQKGKRRDCTSNITTYVNVEKNATDDMPLNIMPDKKESAQECLKAQYQDIRFVIDKVS